MDAYKNMDEDKNIESFVEKIGKMDESISHENIQKDLKSILINQCNSSLSPLFAKYDDFISCTVMLYSIKIDQIRRSNSFNVLNNIAKATIDLIETLKMLYAVGYEIIPHFFHPARLLMPNWKFKPSKL